MSLAPTDKLDPLVQTKIEQGRVADSFLQVIGLEGQRSQAQNDVIEHLKRCAGESGNIFQFAEADGYKITLAAAHRDGASSVLRIIERQLKLSQKAEDNKPQPITKR